MASVFAGRMILEVILHSVKSAGAGEDVAPPPICKQTACMMGLFSRDHGTGCQRPRGPRDQRTKGPRDQRTKGPADQDTRNLAKPSEPPMLAAPSKNKTLDPCAG